MAGSSPEPTRRRAADAWLADARKDLNNGRSLSRHRDEDTGPSGAAFHAEQAVEKAVKALLIYHNIAFPTKHDLALLVGLLPGDLESARIPAAGLTVYAVEQRYVAGAGNPMELNEPVTWDEAEDALAVADECLSTVAADLASAYAEAEAAERSDADPS
jgi:HEPN domain-containing protein